MNVVVLVFVSAVSFGVCAQEDQYCSISKQHTLCLYQSPVASTTCGAVYSTSVNESEIATIVQVHNDLRSALANGGEMRGAPGPQPPASNMRLMTWDTELASIAQRWAQQCNFTHDICRNVARFLVGQNIALTGSNLLDAPLNANWSRIVKMWYNEVAVFSNNSVNPYKFSTTTGHYSQVVWANSYKIGCGFCYHKKIDSSFYSKFYVCNYGPAGNIIGGNTSMYDPGPASSKCPNGTVPNGTGLCA